MCVTNIYIDRYPDGREVVFRHVSTCQYGSPGRPCPTHSVVQNPVRMIQYDEASTQNILNYPVFPSSPPLSSASSQHRYSGGSRRLSRSQSSSDDDRIYIRRSSLKPTRQHRKERIVLVDAPPTPTTPPQLFAGTFTAPSSPDPKGRPIIVDERPFYRESSPRQRQRSRSRPAQWDSPSSSHTNFNLQAEREKEERAQREQAREQARIERRREERLAQLDEEARKARRIAEANEDIQRRAAVPIPTPPRPRTYLRPVVDQTEALQERFGGLTLNGPAPVDAAADEAMRQRLRERQLPNRRSTVGPGHRRHRVLYDDGVYRWE